MNLRLDLTMTWALMRRGLNEVVRVPGAAVPGILAPTIFICGLTAVFGSLTLLPGFSTNDYITFILPVGFLQGAGFTGAATGVNLARDIEQGWFDRLLAAPAPRPVLLTGLVLSASLRSLLPATFLLVVGLAIGVHWPGLLGLLIALILVMGMAVVAATWGTSLAFRFRTQSAAPLMQIGMLLAILTTTAYAPQHLLTGWLQTVAKYNPVTQVVEAARQGFVGSVTWSDTWPGFVTLFALAAVLGFLALRGMRRMTA
jgi:ABC-type multidrug transport system permease subunit